MKELWVEDTGERNEWVTGIYPTVSWPLVPGVFLRGLRLEARVGCALEGVYFVQQDGFVLFLAPNVEREEDPIWDYCCILNLEEYSPLFLMQSVSSPSEQERFVLSVMPLALSQRVPPPILRRARLVLPSSSTSTNASTAPNQSSAGPSPASVLSSLPSAVQQESSPNQVLCAAEKAHKRQSPEQRPPEPQNSRSTDFFNLQKEGSLNRRTHSAGSLLQTTESLPHTPSSAKGVAGTGEALDKSSGQVQPNLPSSSEQSKASSTSLRYLEGSSEHLRQIIKEKDEFIVSLVSLLGRYYLIGKKSTSWEVPEQERTLLSDLTKQADKVLAQFFDK